MASEKKGNGWRRELLRDARGMAALMGVVGLILVSGFALGALQSFRAGQPLYGWVFIINGVLIGVVMPAGGSIRIHYRASTSLGKYYIKLFLYNSIFVAILSSSPIADDGERLKARFLWSCGRE